MAKYRIAWMPGDGIGKDVMDAAKIVMDRIELDAEYIPADVGWEFWQKEADPLPQRTIEILKTVNAALFAAITSKPAPEAEAALDPTMRGLGIKYRSPIVRIRQLFDLYMCVRPCKSYPGNPLNFQENIDVTVFRENTEDVYVGVEYSPVPDSLADALMQANRAFAPFRMLPGDHYAISLKINTLKATERIFKAAFEHAVAHNKKRVTIVHKANVLRATDGLFLKIGRDMAKDYPGIETDDANFDAITTGLLRHPHDYQVLVLPNLYGDIISALAMQMVGGPGFGCSANIGEKLGVFEPTHGSAPKYAGQYKVNPIATILAAKMMLTYLGEHEKAVSIERAVKAVIAEGKVRTYDMKGSNTTIEMAEAIAEKL